MSQAHRVRVLYRSMLHTSKSWYIDRKEWRKYALQLRDRFEANKHLKDPRDIAKVLAQGEVNHTYLTAMWSRSHTRLIPVIAR